MRRSITTRPSVRTRRKVGGDNCVVSAQRTKSRPSGFNAPIVDTGPRRPLSPPMTASAGRSHGSDGVTGPRFFGTERAQGSPDSSGRVAVLDAVFVYEAVRMRVATGPADYASELLASVAFGRDEMRDQRRRR